LEIGGGMKRSPNVLKQAALQGMKLERVGKVVSQTKTRIFGGDTHVEGNLLSVFEIRDVDGRDS
jgi:hypothetical protein